VQGYYGRDHAFFSEYHVATRDRDGFLQWLDTWVLHFANRAEYLDGLGERFRDLRPAQKRLAAEVDYA
jgi:glutaconate CoA-transferase subunit A